MSVRTESLPYVGAATDELAEFERRLRESQRVVYQVAYSVLGNAADAEEVAQEVFLRAYRKRRSLREPEKFRAWVARMSWRLALNYQRAAGRARRRDTAWVESTARPRADVETQAAARESQARLRSEIKRLPEKLRAVLLLSVVEGLDTRGVAAILEIPEGTVRSRLYLARKRLLEAMTR
ncbi:MAG: RNA polymerase sigma factor [Terriglobia bacterium]